MSKSKVIHGDCLDVLYIIEDNSIDLILLDPPYGTTKAKWDSVIPMNDYIEIEENIRGKEILRRLTLEEWILYNKEISPKDSILQFKSQFKKGLWSELNRVSKDNAAIIIFTQQPFTTQIIQSNIKNFRYELIWEKPSATGFLNANKMPMKAHENICVFYKKLPTYNPIKTTGHELKSCNRTTGSELYGEMKDSRYSSTERFPRSVLKFSSDKQKNSLHPTQKPIELIKYLIKTYSNPGEIVLDVAAGSGTVGEASEDLGRNYILIEKEEKYIDIINSRLKAS